MQVSISAFLNLNLKNKQMNTPVSSSLPVGPSSNLPLGQAPIFLPGATLQLSAMIRISPSFLQNIQNESCYLLGFLLYTSFYKIAIWKAEWQRAGGGTHIHSKGRRSSMCSFTPQRTTTARARPNQRQEPKIPSSSPTCITGSQVLRLTLLPSKWMNNKTIHV